MLKNPGVMGIAILTLALGIGANTAIFTVVNAVLLRPLEFRDPSRLMIVAEKSSYPIITTSWENYQDWRDQNHSFEALEATRPATITLTGAGDPERLNIRNITAGLFPLLGVNALVGRTFLPEEDRAGGPPVVILSYALWQRRFGAARDVLDKAITLDSRPYTVVGVMPPGFEVVTPADVFLPFVPWAITLPNDRNWHPGILPIGRLKAGVTQAETRTEMIGIAKRLEEQYPDYNTGKSADVLGLQEQMVQNVRPALLLLLGAVAAVLLIASVNVANLLLARAASRGREVAIRTSMGASRGRLVRQLLTESVLLSLAGGGLGLALSWASLGPLLKLAAGSIPTAFSVSLDRSVLIFTLVISVLVGLVFGIAPALRTARLDLRETLNEGSRGSTTGPGQHRVRGVLVVTEIAMAMLLLVGAGLLLRSFQRLQDVPPGFRTDHLLIADLPLSQTAYAKPEQRFSFFDRAAERARSLPGVSSAAETSFLPVSGNAGGLIHFNITGRPPKSPHDFTVTGFCAVSDGYFETLAIPLRKGRLIQPGDIESAPAVVVINSTMARTYFPNEDPLGKHLQIGATPTDQLPKMEIVGIVGDVLRGLGDEAKAEMYAPYRQIPLLLPIFQLSIVLRTSMEPLEMTSALRSAISQIDPNQPLVNVRSMEQNIQTSVAQPRFRTWLIGTFAGLALVLAAVGVYGVMSYAVTQRTSEIGIRVTMGALPVDIWRLIVGEGVRLALIGVVVGCAGALLLSRVLRSFVFGVSTSDPITFSSVAVVLILVGAAASYLPARRATRVDPLVALRYE
jgi:putative ABC transport system permease protein